MLQAINTSIDTISGIKSNFVKTFVQNEEIQKQLNTYIDAQQSFAKTVAKSTVDFFTTVGTSAVSLDAKKAFSVK
jgi:uncharacterized protein (UPF0332 family)